MRELNFVSERLEDIGKELGVSAYAGFLEETQRKVRKITSADHFYIDIYKPKSTGSELRKYVAAINEASQGTNYIIRFIDETHKGIKIFEDIFASVAFVLLDDDVPENVEIAAKIRQYDEEYRLVVMINFLPTQDVARKVSREMGYRVRAHIVDVKDAEGKTLQDILTGITEAVQLEKLKKLTYSNSIKPVFNFLQEIFATENRTVQTRKLLNNQNTTITRKEEQGLNNSEFMMNIRQVIQKDSSDLEKIFKGKYDDLNKPNIGVFSQKTDKEVKKLQDFEKQVLAEKSEKVQITINENFLKGFVQQIRGKISGELDKDEEYIKSSYQEMISKINTHLRSKGITPIVPEDVYAQFPKKEKVLDSFCYLSRNFTGEIIKKGPAEYFVALRDYTGIIMVAVGLLAPLNAISSLDDVEWLSWLKVMSKGIKYGTAAITVSMIVYGIIDLRRRIPKKRVEEFEREKAKAQELLSQEGKRMFNESSRDWTGAISNWMRETAQLIQGQIDKNIREMQQNKTQQLNNEKQQQQRIQQSVDLFQRNIQTAERHRDQLTQRFRDFVAENEKDLKL
jgi:hypothetical protein